MGERERERVKGKDKREKRKEKELRRGNNSIRFPRAKILFRCCRGGIGMRVTKMDNRLVCC